MNTILSAQQRLDAGELLVFSTPRPRVRHLPLHAHARHGIKALCSETRPVYFVAPGDRFYPEATLPVCAACARKAEA